MDIGATSIDMALADVSGNDFLSAIQSQPMYDKPPEEFLSLCCELILNLVMKQGGHPDQILGIGVGVPGPVDFAQGVWSPHH